MDFILILFLLNYNRNLLKIRECKKIRNNILHAGEIIV